MCRDKVGSEYVAANFIIGQVRQDAVEVIN